MLNFKNFLLQRRHRKISYSQCGEDVILSFIFRNLVPIEKPTYLDVGCHHPFHLNNTYLFYKSGSKGINVDANQNAINLFSKHRKRDINVCVGVSDFNGFLPFYHQKDPSLSTFESNNYNNLNKSITKVEQIEVITISKLIEQYNLNKFPDLLCIDAEGFDAIILKSINFAGSIPKVICVETIKQTSELNWVRDFDLVSFLEFNGYYKHSDTGINTIFINKTSLVHNIKW